MKCLLLLTLFASFAYAADDFESEYVAREKDWAKIQKHKKQVEEERKKGLEEFLAKEDRQAEQKKAALEDFLAKKRNERAPAESAADEDDQKREELRRQSVRAREHYLQKISQKEEAKSKVRSTFDSPEVRKRENKPWRN